MKRLNLGCGLKKLDGYINLDNRSECQPDVVHDLEVFPYPFPEDHFDEILMDHVLEHLSDPLRTLQELYRISKPEARISINCPHFSRNWVHPGHRSAISIHLFDFLDQGNEEVYGDTDFKVEHLELRWLGHSKGKRSWLILRIFNGLINSLARLSPSAAERFWCYHVGGFEELKFRVRVKK